MHDPIRRQYLWSKRWSQRPPLITVWHMDPRKIRDENITTPEYRAYREIRQAPLVARKEEHDGSG